jgi:murein DD-endopeptidase MepM/ murein hydrolase activator NlpD
MTVGAMAGAAALLISTSLPASAFLNTSNGSSASASTASVSAAEPVQRLTVDASAAGAAPARDAYTVVSLVQQIATKYAAAARSTAYTNDPNGTIQWPFPVPVPITYGFGPRSVPGCGFCSTFHQGVDFTPGSGVAIQAIADGVVSKVEFDGGGLGNNVTIDHNINGQKVQSVYGHMLTGSVRVVVGQMVKVTDEVGQVGSTGASTGAHLHLEIHLNNTPVDPFAWLKANAN